MRICKYMVTMVGLIKFSFVQIQKQIYHFVSMHVYLKVFSSAPTICIYPSTPWFAGKVGSLERTFMWNVRRYVWVCDKNITIHEYIHIALIISYIVLVWIESFFNMKLRSTKYRSKVLRLRLDEPGTSRDDRYLNSEYYKYEFSSTLYIFKQAEYNFLS